jgi:hypothetical protein
MPLTSRAPAAHRSPIVLCNQGSADGRGTRHLADGEAVADHGYEAPIIAAQRRDKLLADGDLNGLIIWKRIMTAMDELTRIRGEGERLN